MSEGLGQKKGRREEIWRGKRGRGPAPGMCLGPRNMGIRPWVNGVKGEGMNGVRLLMRRERRANGYMYINRCV